MVFFWQILETLILRTFLPTGGFRQGALAFFIKFWRVPEGETMVFFCCFGQILETLVLRIFLPAGGFRQGAWCFFVKLWRVPEGEIMVFFFYLNLGNVGFAHFSSGREGSSNYRQKGPWRFLSNFKGFRGGNYGIFLANLRNASFTARRFRQRALAFFVKF